ncbi:hypothetical protein IPZ70_09745 [Streptomyces polychromogenes]|nr:hypothetical protein [Streptomyces polychromogenes]
MDVEGAYAAIQLPEGSWWDWDVVAWDSGQLTLAAGHDLAYHHGLELVFGDPLFASCPSAFHDPTFRAPTADELRRVTRLLGGKPPVVVAFEADAGGEEPASCLIAAERLVVSQGTVLRYRHEDTGLDSAVSTGHESTEGHAAT